MGVGEFPSMFAPCLGSCRELLLESAAWQVLPGLWTPGRTAVSRRCLLWLPFRCTEVESASPLTSTCPAAWRPALTLNSERT